MKVVVVGAGISGLATAHAIREADPSVELEVLESEDRAGGKIWTERTGEGYLCERGVPGFLDNKPKTLEVSSGLGLDLVRSFDASRKRFIYSDGKLKALPETPPAFFKSDLLSLPGRLRIVLEIVKSKGTSEDESLAEFATRRLGREAFLKLIDPMATGIYAGDATRLSLKSCFPRIHEIEQTYGSLIRGLLRLQKEARKKGARDKPSAGPGGKLTSYAGGMETLPAAIARGLGSRLRTGCAVEQVERLNGRFSLATTGGETVEADRVVLAAPADAQARMLETMLPEVSALLRRIPYPPVAVCCFGYRKEKVPGNLDGFGFLVPSQERRKVLGVLWESSIFPERSPEGSVLVRSIVGGARNESLPFLNDEKLIDTVMGELEKTMGVRSDPDFVRIYRWERAIPQYLVGHAAGLGEIEKRMAALPGLFLTGNAYRGVSLNDCVANGYRVAARVINKA